ncbi:hypothetical protein P4O66_021820, partial [Electrophorus voltai]
LQRDDGKSHLFSARIKAQEDPMKETGCRNHYRAAQLMHSTSEAVTPVGARALRCWFHGLDMARGGWAALFRFGDSRRIPARFHVPPRPNKARRLAGTRLISDEASISLPQWLKCGFGGLKQSLLYVSGDSFVVNACLARKGLDDWIVKQKYYCAGSRIEQPDSHQKSTCGLSSRAIDPGEHESVAVTGRHCGPERGGERAVYDLATRSRGLTVHGLEDLGKDEEEKQAGRQQDTSHRPIQEVRGNKIMAWFILAHGYVFFWDVTGVPQLALRLLMFNISIGWLNMLCDPLEETCAEGVSDEHYRLEVALPPEKIDSCTAEERIQERESATPTGPHKQLQFEELECAVSVEEDNRQEWTFTLYDFDNNGKVTREDITSLLHTIYEVVDASVNHSPSSSKNLRVKLSVTPDASQRWRNYTHTSAGSKRCECVNTAPQAQGRKVLRGAQELRKEVQSPSEVASSNNHSARSFLSFHVSHHGDHHTQQGCHRHCVDENLERRNHYLDLAGIENYTSRFGTAVPATEPPKPDHASQRPSNQARSRSHEPENGHAHPGHHRRLHTISIETPVLQERAQASARHMHGLRSPRAHRTSPAQGPCGRVMKRGAPSVPAPPVPAPTLHAGPHQGAAPYRRRKQRPKEGPANRALGPPPGAGPVVEKERQICAKRITLSLKFEIPHQLVQLGVTPRKARGIKHGCNLVFSSRTRRITDARLRFVVPCWISGSRRSASCRMGPAVSLRERQGETLPRVPHALRLWHVDA